MKSFLKNSNNEMYSTYNESKSVIAKRLIRTLKKNKYMASVSKNVGVDKLDDIVHKNDNIYYTTIKMKSVDLKRTHILT